MLESRWFMAIGPLGDGNSKKQAVSLYETVTDFAELFVGFSDEDLERAWGWKSYQEGVRHALVRTYEELRELGVRLETKRSVTRRPVTTAQRILGNYHSSYRDLQAVLLGVDPQAATLSPGNDEWTIHHILGHVMAAERQFYPRTKFAVEQHRKGNDYIVEMPLEEVDAIAGDYDDFERTIYRLSLPGVLAYYTTWHKRILQDLMDIKGLELDALSKWWEDEPMTVEFRLHRFDSHLRQHIVQVEKTLEGLEIYPSEAKRLIRWVYYALSQVENAAIGEWSIGEKEIDKQIETLDKRLASIRAVFSVD